MNVGYSLVEGDDRERPQLQNHYIASPVAMHALLLVRPRAHR